MDNQWQDPLLLTDVPWLEHSCDYISMQEQSLRTAEMADPGDFHSDTINEISSQEQIPETTIASKRLPHNGTDYISWEKASFETIEKEIPGSRVSSDTINGLSQLEYSLTSPDLVICAGSPDMHNNEFEETPEFLKIENQRNMVESIEFSPQQDINGSLETQMNNETRAMNMMTPVLFSDVQTSKENVLPEVSLEHLVIPSVQEKVLEISHPVLSINAGGTDMSIIHSGIDFIEDNFFSGGDVIKTETRIGYGEECLSLYQTARIGNFLYKFQTLEAGNYVVDLHLAEIIFTDGPAGMRVFDVFIQEEKVVSGIDIYDLVGPNKPLVLSNLKAFVDGIDGLSIRFESVIGSPIVCGISIKKDRLEGSGTVAYLKDEETSQAGRDPPEEECNGCKCKLERKIWKLQRDYRLQYQEVTEIKRAFEELTRENELKSKECQEAWMSLRELQNELMRKSMHVGSLAYAIEGQVKEKSRWFSSFRDVTKKFKILKIEHIKLSEEALECKKCLADMTQMTTAIQSALNQHVDLEKEHMELKLKFIERDKERKELYNKVLELKGNIRVFCRCRPLNTEEVAGGASMAVDFEAAKDGELAVKTNGAPKKLFKFDAVFSPQADQADVFEDTAPLATSVLDGYNVCIFAYGQTGTGKTFTMEGTEEARGVNYRTLAEVFRIIRDRQGLFNYEISVSVLEVYNEQIRDLLVPGFQPGTTAKRLEVRQVADGIHHVPGLVEAHVNNVNEVWEVLQTGSNARAVGSTNANEHSSRSHCIHCVMVKGENMLNGECTRSKLWLVDLAGSERITKTEVQGERLKETQNINRSLSALGDVISALATKSPHIPFRNSKLTHLLQDSLGGDSKTLMFVQISPNENDLSETLCSLNFASRVRGIEFGPAKKQFDSSDLSKYKQMVEKSKQDMKSKDGYIKKLEETIHNLELKMKARDLNNKNLQDKVKELESQFLIERKLARQHVDTKIAEQQQQQEEQHTVSMKPQVAIRQFGSQKNVCEPTSTQVIRPLTENNYIKPPTPTPPTDNFSKYSDPIEKENKPEMAEQPPVPRRTGRASICTTTTTRQVPPAVPFPRRNSLIPLPTTPSLGLLPQPSLQPLPPFSQADPIKEYTEGVEGNCSEQITGMNRGQKSGTKKLSSILRRSLQKKIYIKSPMQQHIRRGGVNVGMEKVRLSIGSRGRMAQRVLLTNANKGQKEMVYMKQNQKEKERGWNLRTTTKTVF